MVFYHHCSLTLFAALVLALIVIYLQRVLHMAFSAVCLTMALTKVVTLERSFCTEEAK